MFGEIGNEAARSLSLDESDESIFSKAVELGCGESITLEGGLADLIALGRFADQYQMEAIQGDVEEALMDRLAVESCGLILTMAGGSGLVRLERASRELVLREFDQFAACAGFMDVSEEVLGSLLDDDGLVSESEERVLKSVVRWMERGAGGVIRGEGLLRKIRFPFMSADFLLREARRILPESTGLEVLVLESASLKSTAPHFWQEYSLQYLDAEVLVPRRARGVDWAEYAGGGERRLDAGQWSCAVCVHGRGWLCGGLHDGSIRVWSRATLEVERTLTGHTQKVWALVAAGERLISGSSDRGIRVWDVGTGRCEATLDGHTERVRCLAGEREQ